MGIPLHQARQGLRRLREPLLIAPLQGKPVAVGRLLRLDQRGELDDPVDRIALNEARGR